MNTHLLNPESIDVHLGFDEEGLLRFYRSSSISLLYKLFYRRVHEVSCEFLQHGDFYHLHYGLLERIQDDLIQNEQLRRRYHLPDEVKVSSGHKWIECVIWDIILDPLLWQALGIGSAGQATRQYEPLAEIQTQLEEAYATSLLTEFALIEQLRGSLDVTLMRIHAEAKLYTVPGGGKLHKDRGFADFKAYERFMNYLDTHPKKNIVPQDEDTLRQFNRNWQRMHELDTFYHTKQRVEGFDAERGNLYALLTRCFGKN